MIGSEKNRARIGRYPISLSLWIRSKRFAGAKRPGPNSSIN